ncbi:tachykinin-like peptides receptor 99D [Folsomia candida]|uniref:tachykinin-like peptides receptor 99D n=1 Tax=Folsomia candida TaxID=158441 RepID=UPI000B8F389B|nr:tachykinin-like peptides receptor 99D [Folsomia candida]
MGKDTYQGYHESSSSLSSSTPWPYFDLEENMTLLSLMNDSSRSGNDSMDGDMAGWSIPWWRQLLWSILFSVMVIVAAVGNSTVIWIVLAHKRMRTVTNYLLVNLSIADAMVSTLNVLPNFIYMLTGHWPFGEFYCKLVQFVAVLSICGSVFSLMAIAFDRYSAIMNPLRPRMGKRVTLGIAAAIWVVGSIIGAPNIFFFTTYEDTSMGVVLCYAEWPDGPQTESYQESWYNVLFLIFTYVVPITAMGYTYTRVGIELWGSKSIGECTQRQLDNIKSKRRVVKMMIVVVIIFSCCWLPFHSYFILVSLFPEITGFYFVREIFLGIYWLAMSNCMYNPIIYCWFVSRFRRGFQKVFRWCPFIHYSEVEGTTGVVLYPETNRRFRAETTRYSVSGSPENENARVTTNGSSNVHIPLHVLTSTTDSKKSNPTNSTTHYLAPPGYGYHNNGQNQRVRSHNVHNHRHHGKNSNCNSEFM